MADGPPTSGRAAVLVVEDDPLLLADALDLAADAGLVGYGVRSAARAIEMLEHEPSIRVVFTDIRLRESMDGLRLAKAVRSRWPQMAIMVTSGVVTVEVGEVPDGGLFFSKPYAPHAIVEAMRMLAGRA